MNFRADKDIPIYTPHFPGDQQRSKSQFRGDSTTLKYHYFLTYLFLVIITSGMKLISVRE